jgi:nitroreductase
VELIEAIRKRKTTRGFRTDPVPKDIIRKIMADAQRAPSWGNTQPWEFVIATGKPLENIKKKFLDRAAENPNPDLPFPRTFPEFIRARLPYARRQQTPDNRDPKEVLKERQVQSSRLYDCPAVIYILTDREMYEQDGEIINNYAIFDCGLIAQTIMLVAVEYGLGTVAAAASVRCPEVLREELRIPESKVIVLGILIGYPDTGNPQYPVYSESVPLDDIIAWHGF